MLEIKNKTAALPMQASLRSFGKIVDKSPPALFTQDGKIELLI